MSRPKNLLPPVWDCACESCQFQQGQGLIPSSAPVRNCKKGPDCPCHPCQAEYGQKAVAYASSFDPLKGPAVKPETVVKIGGGILLLAALYAAVMWVIANIAAILTVLAFCGAGAGLGWFLFINPASPLKTWRARRAARAIEERKALTEAARQLPPASQQSLPSAAQSSLPPMQVKVLGYTVNDPIPAAQQRKREKRK